MFITNSPEETEKIGRETGITAKVGDIFCLSGNLGAGKTVFAKGFARGLGINDEVLSPTYTIIHEYFGRLPFYHIDAYRCGLSDADELGLCEYLFGSGITLVEWAENIAGILPEYSQWIYISKTLNNDNARIITFGKPA